MPKAPKKKNGRAQAPRKDQPEKTNGNPAHSKESDSGQGPPSARFPIVAIGASAGGLEAFSNLLRALSFEPGMVRSRRSASRCMSTGVLAGSCSLPRCDLELPTGRASLNLLRMARPGLLYELRTLLENARKNSIPAAKEGVVIEGPDGKIEVRMEVIPFRTPAGAERHFLILFEETSPAKTAALPPQPKLPKASLDPRDVQIAQLKQELASTKQYLQSIIEAQEATNEELQSANEEIQSGNEELQSTNEELQTSKEELESANEEFNTVNEEIQHRNQQLAQLSNDLINLLNSATIPMIMLGADLHLRRYTPEAERVLGFSSHDMGKALPTSISILMPPSSSAGCSM